MTQIPIGTIMPFAGNIADATLAAQMKAAGWLPCWGQLVAITDYPDLEGTIFNLYGGDDAITIGLPDLRGRFIRGADTTSPIATALTPLTALPVSGTFLLDSGGAHTHTVPNVPGASTNASRCAGHTTYNWNGGSAATGPARGSASSETHIHTIAAGGDAESRPINIYVDFIVKVADVTTRAQN